jgi:hypothetical protein
VSVASAASVSTATLNEYIADYEMKMSEVDKESFAQVDL